MDFSYNSITIAPKQGHTHLSKAQKAFNNLIQQLEKKRAQLMAWEAAIPPFQQKYAAEFTPLVETSEDMQAEMVRSLDKLSDKTGLTKTERVKIGDLISDMAGELLASREDEEMKAIFNKHSGIDYDSQEAAALELMKSVFEETTGIEMDDDLRSPEDLMKWMQQKALEEQAQHEAAAQAKAERDAKRKKSAKQIAKEEKQQAEAQQISLSIREVYRKLASALHPDRETDPRERERKTALMQRVNQAYEKNNLLQLLELQLELEHINQTDINSIGEERLVHYNKILKGQLRELEVEIIHIEGDFRMRFGIEPYARLSPATLIRTLASDIAHIQQDMGEMKENLKHLQDIKKAKAWLKSVSSEPRRDLFDGYPDCPF